LGERVRLEVVAFVEVLKKTMKVVSLEGVQMSSEQISKAGRLRDLEENKRCGIFITRNGDSSSGGDRAPSSSSSSSTMVAVVVSYDRQSLDEVESFLMGLQQLSHQILLTPHQALFLGDKHVMSCLSQEATSQFNARIYRIRRVITLR